MISPTDHIHAHLAIFLDGQQVAIPANIGVPASGDQHLGATSPHTHDTSGILHIGEGAPAGTGTTMRLTTVDDFFDVWREKAQVAGNNPNSLFDSTHLMNRTADANHVVRMYVNGSLNTQFENYIMGDGDQIVLSYESVTAAGAPQLAPVESQTLLAGSPLWLPMDGFDPQGQNLTYTVTSSNPNLINASVHTGTTGLRMSVANFGDMEFRLFDDLAPRPANRVKTLADQDFYDGIIFHRVLNGFVIQAGDPTGTGSSGSSLGNFDDQFHVDLQHNRTGLLSYAKSTDDTNNSQFFITEGPSRHLDFNHSIFGILTEGENVREMISNVATDANGKPTTNVTITSASSFVDNENGLIELKAAEGASGTADITVTVRDTDNNTVSRTFRVTVTPDTQNGGPFLNDIPAVRTTVNTAANFTLTSQDVEGNAVTYSAVKAGSVNSTVSANATTGVVTVTPPTGFIGTMQVTASVAAATGQPNNTQDKNDAQLVNITVAPAAPTSVDLQDASDSGRSNSDNITNQTNSLQFLVSGVTSGATVQLKAGNTVIGSGTASGSTIVITTTTAIPEGAAAVTATQTVSGVVSDPSTALNVTIDTTAPGAFTSTPPVDGEVGVALSYNAQHPDEKTDGTGIRYSLANGPSGATIDQNTGVLSWTPTSAQVGTQSFAINATDAAGNLRSQSLSVNVGSQKTVRFRLEITDKQFNPLSTLNIGDEFLVRLFTKDLRTGTNTGVFAAFADVTFDGTKAARTTEEIVRGGQYQTALAGNTSTAGLFDELGGIAASLIPIGTNEQLVASVPMRATGSGSLTFTVDPADIAPDHNVLVYGNTASKQDIPASQISFGTASVVINSAIGANADLFNVNEDTTANSLDVLANDTKPANSSGLLSISRAGTTTTSGATEKGGTVTISQDGLRVLYTPPANFVGTDSFFYDAKVGNDTSTAKVDVQVANVNDRPTANNDTASLVEDSVNNVIDVLANDTDLDTSSGDKIKVTAVGTSPNGTVTIGPNGTHVVFTPTANFVGSTSFTYTTADNAGLTSTATVNVTVSPFNDPPTAVNDSATVAEDSGATTISVLSNDSALPDTNETLTVTAVGTTNNGTVTINSGGQTISYTPKANFQGTDTFTYTISDGNGGNATATVSVNVTNSNDAPDAVNDTFTVTKNASGQSLNVLSNDTSSPDPTESLTIQSVSAGSAGGTLTVSSDGKSISYTPVANFTGTETFTYVVSDPGGLTDTATATIDVVNFRPSTLSGFVYTDANNDGVKQSTESPIAGITITLTGTSSVNNAAISQTATTGTDGSYSFANLPPGTYKIKQTQPDFLTDGKDTVGSQGGSVSVNDEISVTIPENTTGTNNNFGEQIQTLRILNAANNVVAYSAALTSPVRFVDLRDRLASRARDNYLLASLDPNASNSAMWSLNGRGWNNFRLSDVNYVNAGSQVELIGERAGATGNPEMVRAVVPASSPSLNFFSDSSGDQLLRINGSPAQFSFALIANGEGEGSSSVEVSAAASATAPSVVADSPATRAVDAVLSHDHDDQDHGSSTDWISNYLSSTRRRSSDYASAVDAVMTGM